MKFAVLGTSAMLLSGCQGKTDFEPQSDGKWHVYSPTTNLFDYAFGADSIFSQVRTVVTIVAVVAMALAGLRLITSENPRDAQIAKTWIISIIGGLVLFWIIPLIFSAGQLNSWFPK